MAKLHLFILSFLLLSTIAPPSDGQPLPEECQKSTHGPCHNKTGSLNLKLIAIAAILVTSMMGVSLPILSKSLPALHPDTNLFVLVKAFASGVILATGYMHVLPDSFDCLTSKCLPEKPWSKFPFTAFIAMFSAVLTLMVDSYAMSWYKKCKTPNQDPESKISGHCHGHGSSGLSIKVDAVPGGCSGIGGMGLGGCILQENSPTALVVVGVLNAVSAGLLNYMALVDLLASDFMGEKLQDNIKLQTISYLAVILGAGGMACVTLDVTIEIEQGTTELKHLGLVKEIAVRFVVLLSNVYNFAKENYNDLKSMAVSAENTVVSTEGQKLKDLTEDIVVFVDVEFDKYAPSNAKKLVAEFQSLIYKTEPLVKILITITQTLITPLITTTIFLLHITKYIIQNITTTTKSAPLVGEAQTPLQKGLTTAQTVLQSAPLVGTAQSLLQSSLNTTKSLVPDTILQNGPDLANQVVNTTNSLVNENPILGAVNSTAQNTLDATKSLVPDTIFQKGDTTKSLVGGIPLLGNVAQSLVTNPTDLTNQVVNTTNSLVNENPILEAVNTAAQNSLDTTKSQVPDTIFQKGTDLVNQAQDTSKSLVGGIPLVDDVAQSLVTNPTNLANQIVNTTNSLVNENPLLEAVAQNIGKEPQATGTKAALQSAYMTLKLAGIPVIAQLWYEVVNQYPTVAELSEFILPVVECLCQLYNKVVTYMDGKGYSIFGYLPLVPIDEMKAAYKLVKTSRDGLSAIGDLLGSNNNQGLSAVGDLLGVNKNN
ncbi:hypothetical protein L1987_11245 [Smallanthus sonchifolius]|uniref:Uncharacterized protein n=1 Tax=Smallanthus sonchifolius TaxID=185202 RepID=A0ACB9JAX4_9ASTR|nr:hypothetical protein L1987_11245 [Smallanthus sonchifolius]